MRVQELVNIKNAYVSAKADKYLSALKRQSLGYRIDAAYSEKTNIINSIVLEALVEANETLYMSDTVRIPAWTTKQSFDNFISKINNYATGNIS